MSPVKVCNMTVAIAMLLLCVVQVCRRQYGWAAVDLALAAVNVSVMVYT